MKKDNWSSIKPETYKSLEKALGRKGVEVTIGNPETGGVTHYFNSKLPPLEIGMQNIKRKIEVEVSSIEQENEELLHLLLKQTLIN